LGSHFAHLLGHLPAVLALYASKETTEVAADSPPDLRPQKAASDYGVQLVKGVRPPLDSGEFAASTPEFEGFLYQRVAMTLNRTAQWAHERAYSGA